MSSESLLNEIKAGSKWEGRDAFPSTVEWETEVNKWLLFIKNNRQFEQFKPRLREKPQIRNETLAEIQTAYFISEIFGCPIIEWEPQGADNKRGEFSFKVPDGVVFCEVKSPGWEADIAKENSNSPRLKEPKYINGEAGSFNNADDVRYAIEKAFPKFLYDRPNLLIIVDDLFVSLKDDKFGVNEVLFYRKLKPPYVDDKQEGVFTNTSFDRLSALATLNVELTNKLSYHWHCYLNPFALHKMPPSFDNKKVVYEIRF